MPLERLEDHSGGSREGHVVRTPSPGKSHVAICFFRNTGITPRVQLLFEGGPCGPM